MNSRLFFMLICDFAMINFHKLPKFTPLQSEARAHMKRTFKQTNDDILALEREKVAVISEIERETEGLRKKIRTWEDAVDTLSSQMNSLIMNEDNLKKKFQAIGECSNSNDDKSRTRETSEDLSLATETMRNKYLTRKPCLDGWLLFNKHCYFHDKKATLSFSNARDYCRKLNAHVADVESRSESKFIYGLTGDEWTWIGVTDEAEEEIWISERTNNVVAYTNWLRGDPDGQNRQNCAILGYKYKRYHKWIDEYCYQLKHFVCKTEATPVK